MPASARETAIPLTARRHRLVAAVTESLAAACRVPAGAKMAIGVSGGPDSLALLVAAAAGRDRRSGPAVDPVAVHVNHHLRDSADADETHVIEVCARLDVPLDVRHVRPGETPGNTPAAARGLRYDALTAAALDAGARYVAVAHHAEDQLETMLIALARGAGLEGLSAMAPARDLADGVRLVRPLLEARKSDCEDLCRAAGIEWRRDPTNADPASVRARLRRDVLPVLEELWPGGAVRAAGAAGLLRAAGTALENELQALFGPATARRWDRATLAKAPPPVIAAGLRRAALHADPDADPGRARLVSAARAVADGRRHPRVFQWPGTARLEITAGQVRLTRGS